MRGVLVAAFLAGFGAGAAFAQPATDEQREAFDVLVERAVIEFTVFLNCQALDPLGAEATVRTWREMVGETIPLMQSAGLSAAEIIAFVERTDDRRMMMDDRTFAEVIRFCRANSDQMQRLRRFEMVFLPREAERIFSGARETPRP